MNGFGTLHQEMILTNCKAQQMRNLILLRTFFFSILLSLPSIGYAAGGVDSGGGKSVVCRNAEGKITSAELLDLWEGRMGIYFGAPRIPFRSHKDFREQMKEVSDHAKGNFAWLGEINYFATRLLDSATYLPAGQRLEPSNDALPVLSPPPGCQFEQAAAYNLRLQRLFFDSEIWASLDETNRAALIVHEVIYDHLRIWARERDSLYTRQVTSYMFANREYAGPHEGVPSDSYVCSTNRTDGALDSIFFLYLNSDSKIVLQPTLVNNVPLFFKDVEEMGWYPGSQLSLDQLVAQADVPIDGSHEGATWFQMLIGKNSPATLGWIQELRASVAPDSKRVKLEVRHYRAEERGVDAPVGVPFYPVTCHKNSH